MPRKRQPPRLVPDPKTGIWHVHHWNGARTVRTSLGTTDEAQASVRFGFWLTEQDTPGAAADRRTIGELLDLYWQEHALPHATDATRIEFALPTLRKHFGLMRPAEIKPATVKHPASILAATAAAWALGLPHDLICGGLRAFDATPKKTIY